jgi:hypothetical protein
MLIYHFFSKIAHFKPANKIQQIMLIRASKYNTSLRWDIKKIKDDANHALWKNMNSSLRASFVVLIKYFLKVNKSSNTYVEKISIVGNKP